jgi:HEAT repeat protein
MTSLRGGDAAVAEIVASGCLMIPPLRAILFSRDPTGLFEIRCRAVDALAKLGAFPVLFEYLETWPRAVDPVERLGDDAVLGAAAIALANSGTKKAFVLLLDLARSGRLLRGVVWGLGRYSHRQAIPMLLSALREDECRLVAEDALGRFGGTAHPALLKLAKTPSEGNPSSSRQRCSALRVLARNPTPRVRSATKMLAKDADPNVAALARELSAQLADAA